MPVLGLLPKPTACPRHTENYWRLRRRRHSRYSQNTGLGKTLRIGLRNASPHVDSIRKQLHESFWSVSSWLLLQQLIPAGDGGYAFNDEHVHLTEAYGELREMHKAIHRPRQRGCG